MAYADTDGAARWGLEHPGLPIEEDRAGRWLVNTPLLEHDHPKIRLQAARLTQLKADESAKAVACFQFVRALHFKVARDPDRVTSCAVLREGAGDWFTKATLMVSLLRALRIPARVRFVSIAPGHLRGLAGVREPAVGHPYTEVRLHGQWLGVDAYAVDLRLRYAARARLALEGRESGYMTRMGGGLEWDGSCSAFSLFGRDEPACLPWTDLGAFADVAQFRDRAGTAGSCYPGKGPLGTALINHRISALRAARVAAAAASA